MKARSKCKKRVLEKREEREQVLSVVYYNEKKRVREKEREEEANDNRS